MLTQSSFILKLNINQIGFELILDKICQIKMLH